MLPSSRRSGSSRRPEVLEDDGRRHFAVDRAEPPADARWVLDGPQEWEWHLAVEDRVADRVRRGADVDGGCGLGRRTRARPDHGELGVSFGALPLDLGPLFFRRPPLGFVRIETEHVPRGAESQQDRPCLHATGLVHPFHRRSDDLGREQGLVERIDDLEAARRSARECEHGARRALSAARGEQRRRQHETDCESHGNTRNPREFEIDTPKPTRYKIHAGSCHFYVRLTN